MTTSSQAGHGQPDHRLFVSGAGVVGLALAIAVAQREWPVTVVGPLDGRRNGRTVALLDGSVRMLAALGVWPSLSASAAPLAVMRIVDDTKSLFGGPPLDFRAADIGLPAFGYNVENATLLEALETRAAQLPTLDRVQSHFASFAPENGALRITAAQGARYQAALLIAADGAASPTRTAAGIAARETSYPQVALTTILRHEAPHRDVSTEFHTRQGPFTLVPMPSANGAPHRSSLVWVMAPAEAERRLGLDAAALAREVDQQSRLILGHVAIEGQVGRFPIRKLMAARLTAPRVALIGEAAHALPPIGAQGLNLSLRDAGVLADLLNTSRHRRLDPGSKVLLDQYERNRRGDVTLRAFGVDALNRSLLSSFPPVDLVRSGGLMALSMLPAARHAAMRLGLMGGDALPSLMR